MLKLKGKTVFTILHLSEPMREQSGSVVECLTRDREAAARASPVSMRCGP